MLVHSAQALAEQCAPAPSSTVLAATGTPSVAEAAALLSAGPGAVLVVGKRKSPRATCAIARQIHKTPVPTAL
ncbi:cobalamin biosynthesis protein [Streptomyces thioluteus]|uniref:cobalamin biosynthesis protein n=1 Tax=Streptomyces thioluteus TaxID=66431 RepID=UPI003CD05E94